MFAWTGLKPGRDVKVKAVRVFVPITVGHHCSDGGLPRRYVVENVVFVKAKHFLSLVSHYTFTAIPTLEAFF